MLYVVHCRNLRSPCVTAGDRCSVAVHNLFTTLCGTLSDEMYLMNVSSCWKKFQHASTICWSYNVSNVNEVKIVPVCHCLSDYCSTASLYPILSISQHHILGTEEHILHSMLMIVLYRVYEVLMQHQYGTFDYQIRYLFARLIQNGDNSPIDDEDISLPEKANHLHQSRALPRALFLPLAFIFRVPVHDKDR